MDAITELRTSTETRVGQCRLDHFHRYQPVDVLRPAYVHARFNAAWNMSDLDATRSGADVLTTLVLAWRPVLNFQVLGSYQHVR
mgnify:CR=1 FL=1